MGQDFSGQHNGQEKKKKKKKAILLEVSLTNTQRAWKTILKLYGGYKSM